MTILQSLVRKNLSRWDCEAAISARRAFMAGRSASLVVYPSGLKMMRFAEPFSDYGMHYEVPPEVWADVSCHDDSDDLPFPC